MKWGRREFLKLFSAAAAEIFVSRNSSWAMSGKFDFQKENSEKFPKRTLGKTGQRVSIIAMGGIVVDKAELDHAAKVVAESIEQGINYFDVAPIYGDAELKLGPALKPYRQNVFLACKTLRRDRLGAKEELNNSLKRLQTDHLDLYQLHGISDVEKDVKAVFSKGGAMETFLAARKQGLIRHIGFTAHSPEAAMAAMREFDFDTMMYPINFVCHYRSDFDRQVLAEARKRNIGIIAIKALAKQRWERPSDRKACPKCWYEPITDPQLSRLALSWTLAQGITTTLPPGEESLYHLVVKLAPECKPPSADEISQLNKAAAGFEPLFPKGWTASKTA